MLSQPQIQFYRENGYLGVNDVCSPGEVADLRRVTDEFVDKSRALVQGDATFDLEPSHSRETPRLRRISNTAKLHPVYRHTLTHRGQPTDQPRTAAVPVRLPRPRPDSLPKGSIYLTQSVLKNRTYATPAT